MALYLNLFHEIQKQKLQRQRDPFKIAIMVALLIAVGFIAYYLWRVEAVMSAKNEVIRLQSEWDSTEPKAKAAELLRDQLDQNDRLVAALEHHVENRFYWAPLLERVLKIVPPDIQVTGLGGAITNAGLKKVKLTVNGTTAGDQPRTVAEDLRTSLQNKLAQTYQQTTSTFVSLEDGAPIQYQGKGVPSAIFSIDVTFVCPDVDPDLRQPLRQSSKR